MKIEIFDVNYDKAVFKDEIHKGEINFTHRVLGIASHLSNYIQAFFMSTFYKRYFPDDIEKLEIRVNIIKKERGDGE